MYPDGSRTAKYRYNYAHAGRPEWKSRFTSVILEGHDEDAQVEAVHMPRRGSRPRSGLDHEPRAGSAAARPSGGHGPGTDIYAPVDTGAQHGHGGRPDEAVSAPQDHRS